MNNQKIDTDWTGTLATSSVLLTDVNDKAAAEGTQKAIDEAIRVTKKLSLIHI